MSSRQEATSEQELYEKLKRSEFCDLADGLKRSLATISDNVDQAISFVKNFFKHVVKTQGDKSGEQLPQELLVSIEVGLQAVSKVFKGADCTDLTNVLYHIFFLLMMRKCFPQALAASRLMLSLMQSLSSHDSKTLVIVTNMYVLLWNTALNLCKDSSPEPLQEYELLLLAVQFLCFKDDFKAISERVSYLATWCASNLKDVKKLISVYQTILPCVRGALLRCPDELRSRTPFLVGMVLEECRLLSKLGERVSPRAEWRKVADPSVFGKETQLYSDVSSLLDLVDRAYRLHHSALTNGPCHAVKIPETASWQTCRPGSQEFDCRLAVVAAVKTKLVELLCLVEAQPQKQDFTKVVTRALEFSPLFKRHLEQLHAVEANGSEVTLAFAVLRILLAFHLYLARDTKDEKHLAKIFGRVLDLCPEPSQKMVNNYIKQIKDVSSMALTLYTFAYISYQRKLTQFTIPLSVLSVDWTALCIKQNADIGIEAEKTFWRRCELLIWEYRQERLYEEALNLMGRFLPLVPGVRAQVVTRWVKVKKEIADPALLKRNLQDQFQVSGEAVLSNDDRFELLTAELNVSMKEGLSGECCLGVLLELKRMALEMSDPLKSCYAQTQTSYFLARFAHLEHAVNDTFDESLQKATDSAKGLLETDGHNAPVAKLLLAASYFWLYMKGIDTLRNLAARQVTEAAVDPAEMKCTDPVLSQALAEDKDYSCDITLNYWHINVGHELASQEILDQAVELWSSALDGCASDWSTLLRDLSEGWFLDQVKVVAEVYASSFRVSEEIKAIVLWYKVARELKLDHEIVLAGASLSNSLLKVGMVEAASEVVLQSLSTLETLEDSLSKLHFMLAQSRVLYAKAQFAEGFRLLSEVLKHPLMERNTKSCLLLMSEAKQLACHYSLLPTAISAASREGLNETPITLAQEALKMALAVMRYVGEEAIVETYDLRTVWILERAMLSSAALVGQLYISIGAAREAYSYLKEYLHKAQVVVSATRCARLILLIAHMDLMCEKLQDVKHKLTVVEFMLHVDNFSLPQPSSIERPIDDADDSLPGEEDIYRPSLASKPCLPVALRQFLARESGPKLQVSVPKLVEKHSPECLCQLCRFLSTKQLWLERDLLKCLLYLTVGDISAAIGGFESLLAFLDVLGKHLKRETATAASFLKSCLPDSFCRAVDKSVGSWGELLLLRGTILLHLSEALQVRKSYAASLDRVNEALELFVQRRSGEKSFWKVFASLKHQKVKVLLSMLHQTVGSSADPKRGSLWISNTNHQAGSPEACRSPVVSPPRQRARDQAVLRVPNAPKASKNSRMDQYLKSLGQLQQQKQRMQLDKGPKGAFQVYDEDSDNCGDKRGGSKPTRRASARNAHSSRCSKDTLETPRMPKKVVQARRQAAKTDLSTPAAAYAAPPATGVASEQSLSREQSVVLNIVEEEEAISAVARLSIHPLDANDSGSLHFVQQESLVTEQQLPACKPKASLEELKQLLDEAFQLIIHFPPCPLYSEMCRTMLQLLKLQGGCTTEQGGALFWYLTQTAAVTLQHVGLTCLRKKLRKQAGMVQQGGPQGMLSGADLNKADTLGFKLYSKCSSQALTETLDLLPSDWTVVQLATAGPVLKSANGTLLTPDLLVCQYRKNKEPIMVQLSGSSDAQFHVSLFKQFKTILDESSATMKMTEPSVWWSVRRGLDKRLKELLTSMEEVWMGCWKGVFQGKIADATARQALEASVAAVLAKAAKHKLHCSSKRLLQAVLDSDLTNYQLSVAVCRLFGIAHTHPAHNGLVQAIKLRAVKDTLERHPVILILDKAIQGLPWENVPILQNNPVSRVPSLAYLCAQLLYYSQKLDNVYVCGADTSRTYFILNPSNDIPKTQAQFESVFREQGWPGVIGQGPQKDEFRAAIAGKDVILYCGHGSGREYLSGDLIEQMLCRACPILMGCGSGRLKVFGPKIEPFGVVLQYWLGGSPCVVANLWDVTDRDIDRFTDGLLTSWIPSLGGEAHIPDITKAVQEARKACKLKYLIGAAPVVYGIPVQSLAAPQSR